MRSIFLDIYRCIVSVLFFILLFFILLRINGYSLYYLFGCFTLYVNFCEITLQFLLNTKEFYTFTGECTHLNRKELTIPFFGDAVPGSARFVDSNEIKRIRRLRAACALKRITVGMFQ